MSVQKSLQSGQSGRQSALIMDDFNAYAKTVSGESLTKIAGQDCINLDKVAMWSVFQIQPKCVGPDVCVAVACQNCAEFSECISLTGPCNKFAEVDTVLTFNFRQGLRQSHQSGSQSALIRDDSQGLHEDSLWRVSDLSQVRIVFIWTKWLLGLCIAIQPKISVQIQMFLLQWRINF